MLEIRATKKETTSKIQLLLQDVVIMLTQVMMVDGFGMGLIFARNSQLK